MDGFVCEFCGNVFSSQNNMAMHKKTAKYCIALQDKQQRRQTHECICGKAFTRAYTLKVHATKCPVKISHDAEEEIERLRSSELEVETLRETIEDLEEKNIVAEQKIEDVEQELRDVKEKNIALEKELKGARAKIKELKAENIELKLSLENGKGQIKVYKERPGTVNQYINPKLLNIKCETIPPLTLEYVKKEVDCGKYTYENYIRGEKGLVDFISALITEDDQRSYVCTDAARNKFHRLIETREWKEDNGANFLNKIFDSLKDRATDYYKRIVEMSESDGEQDTGDFLMDKTKRMFFGITSPKSKDRAELFNRIRTEVRQLAAV